LLTDGTDEDGVARNSAPFRKKSAPGPLVGTEVAAAPLVKYSVAARVSCSGVIGGP
jgi:hypothetical protein